MMNSVVIREAAADDAVQLLEYLKTIGGETDNLTFGKEGLPISAAREAQFLEQTRGEKTSVQLLACIGGEIVGDGSLHGLPRRMAHRAELGISVKKKYWNMGIGSMLMEALLARARERGIEMLNLEVRSDNAGAIHLYRKYGFRYIGTSPAYFKIDGKYCDVDSMYLDLR